MTKPQVQPEIQKPKPVTKPQVQPEIQEPKPVTKQQVQPEIQKPKPVTKPQVQPPRQSMPDNPAVLTERPVHQKKTYSTGEVFEITEDNRNPRKK